MPAASQAGAGLERQSTLLTTALSLLRGTLEHCVGPPAQRIGARSARRSGHVSHVETLSIDLSFMALQFILGLLPLARSI